MRSAMADLVAAVEAATYTAWPAREMSELGSWQLRFADGFSRRGNSVLALGEIPHDLVERVAWCRKWYADRGLDLVFRMTPMCDPALDKLLEAHGFTREGETHVMVGELSAPDTPPPPLPEVPTARWWSAMARLWSIDETRQPAWRSIVERVEPPAAYVLAANGETDNAAGLGVVAGDWLGLFEVVVAEDKRRQGWGIELTSSLLEWGYSQGARRAFLQVVVENDPAIALYERLGFRKLYRYWYRRTPD